MDKSASNEAPSCIVVSIKISSKLINSIIKIINARCALAFNLKSSVKCYLDPSALEQSILIAVASCFFGYDLIVTAVINTIVVKGCMNKFFKLTDHTPVIISLGNAGSALFGEPVWVKLEVKLCGAATLDIERHLIPTFFNVTIDGNKSFALPGAVCVGNAHNLFHSLPSIFHLALDIANGLAIIIFVVVGLAMKVIVKKFGERLILKHKSNKVAYLATSLFLVCIVATDADPIARI